jgi:multidrug efflux pump
MSILSSSIHHSRSTFCVLLLIVLAGLFARGNMSLETKPRIVIPFVLVQVALEGVSPEDGARLLVRPLEKELRTLKGVDELIANAYENVAVVIVKFEADEDVQQAVSDVREAVDRAKAELPSDAEEPVVEELSADDFPAIVVTFSGEAVQERALFQSAQFFKRQFENLPGVLEASLVGHREEVVEAVIDPARLAHHQITSSDLAAAVMNNNLLVPAGELDTGVGRFSIKVPGLIETHADVYNLPLKSTTDGVVRLGEVATIRRTFKDPDRNISVNGRRAIAVEVEKRSDAGSIEVSAAVREALINFGEQIPNGVEINYVVDQSDYTRDMVGEMEGNILTAMALVMVIVVAALGFRSGLLVGMAIPFSLLFALIIVYQLDYTINFMVMFGMLLALGMLIDGAIVITEYADRKMAEGLNSQQAYINATRRMFWPVTASVATTLAAFLPIMFWPGVSGAFMRYLPVTVFAVLAGSLLYALFFAPVMGAIFGRGAMDKKHQAYLSHLESDPPEQLPGLTGRYARLLQKLLQRPHYLFVLSLLTLVAIYIAFINFNNGVIFFAETENKYGTVEVRAQGNLSVEEVRLLSHEVEQRILAVPGLNTLYSSSGFGSGSQGHTRGASKDQIANMLVELDDPKVLDRSTREIFEEIRQATADMAGIYVSAEAFEGGPPVGKPIQIQLEGLQRDKLVAAARYLGDVMAREFDGLRDITDTTSLPGIDWEMKVDRALAAQLGANVVEVGRAVQFVTNGAKIGEYRPDDADEEVDIRVRYPVQERGLDELDKLRVNTAQGVVPISSFVQRVAKPRVDKVKRINGVEVVTVLADVEEGVLADDKVTEIKQWLEENPLDPAINIVFRGANEEQNDSIAFLKVAFSLALFLMFILLVTQFNSFYQAALILSSVVMSTAGVLLGLLVTQSSFSTILTGVGIVALAGIVVNNNIVLIDTYNYLRRENPQLSSVEAAIRAAAQRLRPVFLTTITTILGLLPIASNVSIDLIDRTVIVGGVIASFWVPLASAIIHGLIFATLLTLIVTPVMLVLPERLKLLLGKSQKTSVELQTS